MVPALQAQLKDVRNALDNLMKAIEKGVFTRTTKARLEELEAEEERLIKCIQEEEAKIPKISKEMILYTLYKYRDMDMRVQKNRERLIDGFVKAIIVYDDYFKVHLTYTDEPIDMPTTEEIEFMDQSSDIASAVSPKKKDIRKDVLLFCRTGIERPLRKHAGGMFLGRGRFQRRMDTAKGRGQAPLIHACDVFPNITEQDVLLFCDHFCCCYFFFLGFVV